MPTLFLSIEAPLYLSSSLPIKQAFVAFEWPRHLWSSRLKVSSKPSISSSTSHFLSRLRQFLSSFASSLFTVLVWFLFDRSRSIVWFLFDRSSVGLGQK